MHRARRLAAAASLAALAALALPGAALHAQEGPEEPAAAAPDPAVARKRGKIARLLELTRWRELFLAELDAGFDAQVKTGQLPPNFGAKFREVADLDALEEMVVDSWEGVIDEPTLDAAIEFLSSEAGTRFAAAQVQVPGLLKEKVFPWAMEMGMKTMQAIMEEPATEEEEEEGGGWNPLANLRKAKLSSNETAAIATLRNLASCQAQIQTSGKIDCDSDGIGEYGTFLELTGTVAVRHGFREGGSGEPWEPSSADFSKQGTPVNPAILSPALSGVDDQGIVAKSGYCFRIHLPDSGNPSGFVHETGPWESVGLSGGTGRIGVDLAETTWCAYAWPTKRGNSGNRVFFVNQSGDVMQSSNEVAQWEGEKAPPGNAAFRGAGCTSRFAVGTTGNDGDVWKVTN